MRIRVILSLLLLLISVNPISGWCLKSLGVQDCDFELLHVSIHSFRAFLSVKNPGVSLVETSWPEKFLPFVARRFPNAQAHALASGCRRIVQSSQTAVDPQQRLWVMDNGSWDCPPKLLIYNLRTPWNTEVHRHVFSNATDGIFTSLTVDPVSHGGNTRAYLTVKGSNCFVVYSLEEKHFWTLCSKENAQFSESVILPTGQLYLYDSDRNTLYFADMRGIREREFRTDDIILWETLSMGSLLGTAHSLIVDSQHFLYYIIPRDGVVVKWNTEKPLTAENHEVLHFQSPDMVTLLWGFQESLWVINAVAIGDNHSHRI